ncbi:MAG TPA: hypothetical protein VJ485_00540 [archaeon]|nr:hypothetical protein [archaeon]
MEGTFWEKFGLSLVILGMVIGAIGAAGSFLVSGWMISVFYVGFFMTLLGFAIAVLTKAGPKK